MSTIDPNSRPWRRPGTARALRTTAWIIAAASWVPVTAAFLAPDDGRGAPPQLVSAIWLMAALVITTGAALFDHVARRDREFGDASFLARGVGAALTGVALGWAILLVGGGPTALGLVLLLVAVLLCAGGVVLYCSPALLQRSRRRRAEREGTARRMAASAAGTLTEVTMFFRRGPYPYYRCTVAFTDHSGTRRWVTRTAPAEVFGPKAGDPVTVHYDSARPGRARSIVLTWPPRRF